jgi:hypothetical protein
LDLNDRFLGVDGSDWYDVRMPRKIAVNSARGAEFVGQIRQFLTGIDAPCPLVLKDPRITALTPFWFAAARQIGRGVCVVIPVRHPTEVAASLARRDNLPIEQSDALWLKYNLLAEQASRGLPRVFVAYERLLADWRKEVGRISHGLGLDLVPSAEVDDFLDPELRRERRPDRGPDIRPSLRLVYRQLEAATRGDRLDTDLFDREFRRYAQAGLSAANDRTEDFSAETRLGGLQRLFRRPAWA